MKLVCKKLGIAVTRVAQTAISIVMLGEVSLGGPCMRSCSMLTPNDGADFESRNGA